MSKKNNYIIGIGASAGGLEALNSFFSSTTEIYQNTNLAYVIVSHLSPDYENPLVDIISKNTKLPVQEINHNTKVEYNHVYIIPPGKQLLLKNNVFKLSSRNEGKTAFRPINTFFESLSNELKEKAICVLLSGTGEDGSLSLQKVKENGGFVVVSDPDFSKFDGMPENAIRTGLVDLVLHPKNMMSSILSYINGNESMFANSKIFSSTKSLNKLFELIKEAYDIDFNLYKKNTLVRRLQRRLVINKSDSLEKYVDFLQKNKNELEQLQHEFLIGVSSFFRDKKAYETIQNKIIPSIFTGLKKEQNIRIWCCGCSRGEEAYSLAILFKEYMLKNNINNVVKIFATDINKEALEAGNAGKYNIQDLKDIPKKILDKYFQPTSNYTFKIAQNIRDMVVFAYHNILKDPPFTKIDLISCRNMMIYIKPEIQQKIISLFHYSIKNNGYLFLGSSETTGKYENSDIETIDRKYKIYKFKHSTKYISNSIYEKPYLNKKTSSNFWDTTNINVSPNQYNERLLNRALIQRYVPPTIFVNNTMKLVHLFGDTKPYLTLPTNTVRLNIEVMIVDALKILVLTGIKQCFKNKKPIFYTNVEYNIKRKTEMLDIEIRYNIDEISDQNLVQVSFIKSLNEDSKKEEKTKLDLGKYPKKYITDLEFQLRDSKEDLQIVTQEMEITNEELQTSNEELLTTNEELQSTNEELQSVNEELLMINTEHQEKIKELTELNDDINNLLDNIDVSTIFLDKNLNIRRFNDALNLDLKLRIRDIGRPIQEMNLQLKYKGFINDVQKVLTAEVNFSKEIQTDNGLWIMMSIQPYNNTLGKVTGVVITYYNVTTLKNLSHAYEKTAKEYFEKDEKLNLLLEGYPDLIIEFDKQANIIAVIAGKNYESPIGPEGSTAELLINKNINELSFIPLNLKKALLNAISNTIKNETSYKQIVKVKNKKQSYTYLEIRTGSINENIVTCVIRDITELQNALEKLDKKVAELKNTNKKLKKYIDSNLELEKFAYIASHDMKEPLRNIIAFSQLIKNKIDKKDYTNIDEYLQLVITSGERMFNLIEEVLEYSKVETKDFNSKKVDLNKLINEITADFNISIQSRNINIKIDDMGEFYGDEVLIRKSFLNLISNAIKFNNKKEPLIQIKNLSTETNYNYSIIDNGIGIKEDYFDTIFLLFKRLHSKDDYDGTGLGLSICKKAIEKHGGSIKVKSEINKGTTFTISIPK